MENNQGLGKFGETQAADYLETRGFIIVERNFRTPYGELDLIARKDSNLVFVEVKTRQTKSLGYPEISVTRQKMQHIKDSAEYYIQEHPDIDLDWRIDVIAIQYKDPKNFEVEWFENV